MIIQAIGDITTIVQLLNSTIDRVENRSITSVKGCEIDMSDGS